MRRGGLCLSCSVMAVLVELFLTLAEGSFA